MRSVFSDEKKLSIAALSQTLPDRLMLQAASATNWAVIPALIDQPATRRENDACAKWRLRGRVEPIARHYPVD